MQKIAPGLWHWEASHPEWELSEPWAQDVSSYAIEDGGRLLLFDPLDLPAELEELAAERETAIVLTAPWHERDTRSLMERLGLPVYTPPVDTAQDLIDKFGITAEQAGDGSPDLRWLRERGDGNSTCGATSCRSRSRSSRAGSPTTSCSGSRASAPLSPETRWPTSGKDWGSRTNGSAKA
jgi:hypothetical protein